MRFRGVICRDAAHARVAAHRMIVIADPQRAVRLAEATHGAKVITLDISKPLAEAIAPITSAGGSADTVLPSSKPSTMARVRAPRPCWVNQGSWAR